MYEIRPVSLHGVLATLDLARAQGVALDAVLQGAGALPKDLTAPDAAITLEQELVVFDNARRAMNQQSLGLQIGYSMPVSTLGLLGYALLVAPTLNDALTCGLQFPIQLASQFSPALVQIGGDLHFVANDNHGFFESHSFFCDVFMSATLRIIHDCLQSPEEPVSLHFKRPAPDNVQPYRQLFRGDIRFSSHSDSLQLPKALLARKPPLADPISYRAMLALAQAREKELEASKGTGFVGEVISLIKSDILRYGDLGSVAQALNVSERTLRRRLAERGVTFKRLHNAARHQQANQLLSGTLLPLEVISQRLGFSDHSAFVHAYHKWAGVSPGRFRRSLRGGQG